MSYSVIILPRADRDFQQIYEYNRQSSKKGADAWANAFYRALKRLHSQPTALALAPESENYQEDIRQLLFKTRQGLTYRALFVTRGDRVLIIHLRGPGQDTMSREEIQLPE